MTARLVGFPTASNPLASICCHCGKHLTALESHPCTHARSNTFRITSLRKNRGRGGPEFQNGNRHPSPSDFFVTPASELHAPTIHTSTTPCHPERSDRLAFLSRHDKAPLARNNPTPNRSVLAFFVTSLHPRFITLALRSEDSSPKSEGSPLLSPQSHTFLHPFIKPLHISIPSANPYPLLHSDRGARKNSRQRYTISTKLRTRVSNSFVIFMCRKSGPGPRSISFPLLLPCSRLRSFARISPPIHPHPRIPLPPHDPRFRYRPKTTSNLPDGGRPNPLLPAPNLSAVPNARSVTRRSRAHRP